MRIILALISVLIFLVSILTSLSASLSMKTIYDHEKSSPFECGFDPKVSARFPFSMHFFLVAMIFLIFDVEIALLLPLIVIQKTSNLTVWYIMSSFFFMILLLGLYHEWNQGALDWAN
nr:NADH dehydrogenase subunit 3 [Rhomboptera ligata]